MSYSDFFGVVMFGARPWRLTASSVSLSLLKGSLKYATFLGIVLFRVERHESDGRLVARNYNWLKWPSVVIRIVMTYFHIKVYGDYLDVFEFSHMKLLLITHVVISFVCSAFTIVMQLWYGEQVLSMVNSFFSLFHRLRAILGCKDMPFGGKWVAGFMILKVFCLMYESLYLISDFLTDYNDSMALAYVISVYNSINTSVLVHAYFVACLSIAIAYEQINSYIRNDLRNELVKMKEPGRRQLKAVGYRLTEILSIYEEIYQVGAAFNRLFEFPLCVILMFDFMSIASLLFFILSKFGRLRLWLLMLKIVLDVLLLTMVVYIASSNSRVIRGLSLENYYLTDDKWWNLKFEMFFNRLIFKEFRIRPLGLFELSNDLMLVFGSGLVTYLTFAVQYNLQNRKSLELRHGMGAS